MADSKLGASDIEKRDVGHVDSDLGEKDRKHSVVLDDPNLLSSAYDGENREHQMGVWEAVKLHPMACFWAFIFCFTIVSLIHRISDTQLTANRSWSPSTCS